MPVCTHTHTHSLIMLINYSPSLLPVLLSSWVLSSSAHYWDDPTNGHRSGSTLSGLHWQPQRKGISNLYLALNYMKLFYEP